MITERSTSGLRFQCTGLKTAWAKQLPDERKSGSAMSVTALDLLIVAMNESQEVVSQEDGVIEEIKHTTPRLLSRIANLRDEFDGLLQQANTLRDQLAVAAKRSNTAFSDLRQRMDWLLSGIKHHQAKETDLIYEAFNVDIGVGD